MALDLTKIGNTLSVSSPSSIATVPTTLTSQNMKSAPSVSVTPPPDNTNYAGMLAAAQQQALSIQQPIQQQQQAQLPEKNPNPPVPGQSMGGSVNGGFDIKSYVDSITGVQQPSATQAYQTGYDQSGLAKQEADIATKTAVQKEAESRLKIVSNQIAEINAKAQAERLYDPAKDPANAGRGITTGGIQPEYAKQNERLRSYAIDILPLQAQGAMIQAEVETAQGNTQAAQDLYTKAQDHFDKLFTLQMQDSERKYNFQTNLIDKVYAFADKQEQRTLDALKLQSQQDFQVKQDEVAYQRQLQRDKLQYQQDVSKINLQNSLKKTEETPTAGTLQLAQIKSNVDETNTLASDKYLSTAVGTNPLGRISFSDAFTGGKSNFIAGVEQLRSQLSLQSLINAKAQGATFGALSEGELLLLQNSGTKLSKWAIVDPKTKEVTGYKASEKDFKTELDKINNFAKLDYILKGGNPTDVGAVLQVDGTYLVKNSDGTYTILK